MIWTFDTIFDLDGLGRIEGSVLTDAFVMVVTDKQENSELHLATGIQKSEERYNVIANVFKDIFPFSQKCTTESFTDFRINRLGQRLSLHQASF